ncbi:MAG: hypothetical protein IJP66_02000 [Kiritimatiellae bacterium]|nr:hypothetical protein [Kiritimatiellia bacterium]
MSRYSPLAWSASRRPISFGRPTRPPRGAYDADIAFFKAGLKEYFFSLAADRAFLTLERWEELKARVRAGATLYLSWNDTFLDSMEEVGGVEVAFRERRAGTDLCDFVDFKVEIPYSVKRRFRATTADAGASFPGALIQTELCRDVFITGEA